MIDEISTDDWSSITKSLTILTRKFDETEYTTFILFGFGTEIKQELPNYDLTELHECFVASLLKLHSLAIKDEEYLVAKLIVQVVDVQTDIVEEFLDLEVNSEYRDENHVWLTATRDYIQMVFQHNVKYK